MTKENQHRLLFLKSLALIVTLIMLGIISFIMLVVPLSFTKTQPTRAILGSQPLRGTNETLYFAVEFTSSLPLERVSRILFWKSKDVNQEVTSTNRIIEVHGHPIPNSELGVYIVNTGYKLERIALDPKEQAKIFDDATKTGNGSWQDDDLWKSKILSRMR